MNLVTIFFRVNGILISREKRITAPINRMKKKVILGKGERNDKWDTGREIIR